MSRIRKSVPPAFVLLFIFFAVSQLATVLITGEWKNPSGEMVAKWEDHVRALRGALPSGVDRVGYIDDSMISADAASFDGSEFQLMQYSLAPVALQIGSGREWIVGNFRDGGGLEAWLAGQIGTYEIREFGFGLYLIHNVGN